MIRKLLCCASLGGLFVLGAPARALPALHVAQAGNQSTQAKSVSGKVTAIASDKKSFTMDVGDGQSKQSMQFTIDANTQVTGRVHVGTTANVQYQSTQDGQLLALSISPQTTD